MKILHTKQGAALMQVLLVTVILAGMATMLLRALLSRTSAARQTRKTVSSQILINACQGQVNTMWSNKTPEAFASDLRDGIMYRDTSNQKVYYFLCDTQNIDNIQYQVRAYFETNVSKNPYKNTKYAAGTAAGLVDGNNKREIVYEIIRN